MFTWLITQYLLSKEQEGKLVHNGSKVSARIDLVHVLMGKKKLGI